MAGSESADGACDATVTLDRASGALARGGVRVGQVRRSSALSGTVTFGPSQYAYRLQAPFARGYALVLTEGAREVLVLEYGWRDGHRLHDARGTAFDYDGTRLMQQGVELARLTVRPTGYAVRWSAPLAAPWCDELSGLLIVDALYAAREGPFARFGEVPAPEDRTFANG